MGWGTVSGQHRPAHGQEVAGSPRRLRGSSLRAQRGGELPVPPSPLLAQQPARAATHPPLLAAGAGGQPLLCVELLGPRGLS